eukprot:scaffold155359_cov52-Attheya_sp.AAC.4
MGGSCSSVGSHEIIDANDPRRRHENPSTSRYISPRQRQVILGPVRRNSTSALYRRESGHRRAELMAEDRLGRHFSGGRRTSETPTAGGISNSPFGSLIWSHEDLVYSIRDRDISEIQQLQRELSAMETFFTSLRVSTYGQGFDHPNEENDENTAHSGPPPASTNVIRDLAVIIVEEQDLVDETNRKCCVCFASNSLGTRVTRLPCGHLFHGTCVMQWLNTHCTCPICRYELPTEDSFYEIGRLERMKNRIPRYRQYELERMSHTELQALASNNTRKNCPQSSLKKTDLIQMIVGSNKVDVLPNLESVSYKRSALRSMSHDSLKETMSSAGIPVDNSSELSKEEMVQQFIKSDVLVLLPEEDSSTSLSMTDCQYEDQ